MTLLVWVVYVASLIQIFFLASWVPTLAQRSGVDPHVSLDAVMIMQVGAIVGGLATGRGIDRWRAAALIPAYLIGVVSVAAFGVALGAGATAIFVCAFFMGVGVMGAQNGMNGLASRLYPTFMRSTGVSVAIGVGRIGSVTGPVIGGAMIALGLPATTMFLIASVPPVVATAAVIGLWLWDRQRIRAGITAPADVSASQSESSSQVGRAA
jgi:AAHS family 4-hydroxybenzoate transporter-like MFS transporter